MIPLISSADAIIERLRRYALSFGAPSYCRVFAASHYEAALKAAGDIDKPAAFLLFDGISPVGNDLMQIAEGSYQQNMVENWQIIIITDSQSKDDSGAALQKQAIECTESVIKALIGWAPGYNPATGSPGTRWRPPCQFESAWLQDPENGAIIGAAVNVRLISTLAATDGYPPDTTDLNEIRIAATGGARATQSTDPPAPAVVSNFTAISSYGAPGNTGYGDNKENRAALSHEAGITILPDGGFQFPDTDTPGAGLVLPLSAADLANAGDMLVLSFTARRGPTAAHQTLLQALAGVYDGGDEDILQFTDSALQWEGTQAANADTNAALIAPATELTVSAMVTAGSLQGNKRNATIKIAVSGGGDSWISPATPGSFYEFGGANRYFAQFSFGGQGSHSYDGYIKNIKIARLGAALTDADLQALTPGNIV